MTQASSSCVMITHAPEMDYRRDFVALPRNYGSPEYFARADIQALTQTVTENLRQLDERTDFTRTLKGRKVVIKPNLVTVYSDMGLKEKDYPETTDPRVLDAVVAFFQQYSQQIVIVESSGRGVPTRGSFRVAGIDRLAGYRNAQLIALEEQPTDRYYIPRAKVSKEVYVPRIFSEIIAGDAFYVSVPKLKTNLYTGVTLGFKNSMGILPYNLRQRSHHFKIDQKLVDLLYLFQPDLVVIDGIIGGEGNCPAPVDPVDAHVIISGNNSVETDRVATRMMGFDPQDIELMRCADACGFGDPTVEVIGDARVTSFRPADPSLTNEAFRAQFPNVRVYTGHKMSHAPQLQACMTRSEETAQAMELSCRGGCLATTRFAFDMFMREGQRQDFSLVVLMGSGVEVDGVLCYLDAQGGLIPVEDILRQPGKKLAVGSCTRGLKERVDVFVDGCMPYPNSPHVAVHRLTGTLCNVVSPRNKHLLPLLLDTLKMCESRKRLYRAGHRLDCPRPFVHDEAEKHRLEQADQTQEPVRLEIPPLTPQEIRQLCNAENWAVLATFTG